jgi:hypothetical protein
MDDRTAELRDLFVETTGEEHVTERQAAARGSLSTADDATVDERLEALVAAMRDRYEFASDLPDSALCRVVRAFFDPEFAGAAESWSAEADAALASSLPTAADAEAAFRARMDLHLVADADRDPPFPYDALRDLVLDASDGNVTADQDASGDGDNVGGTTPDDDLDEALAASLPTEADPATVRRYRRVVEADLASRAANHRYRDAFADLLTDAALSTRLATDARRDGLEEATEDIETDVSL